MAKDGRGPPILVVSPSRPGRSGFTLHRTGRMAMLHGLRGRIPHGLRTSFYIRPRIRPETVNYPPLRPFVLCPDPNAPGPPEPTLPLTST